MNKLTSGHEVQAIGIHCQAGDGVQVGHHGVDQLTCTSIATGGGSTYWWEDPDVIPPLPSLPSCNGGRGLAEVEPWMEPQDPHHQARLI